MSAVHDRKRKLPHDSRIEVVLLATGKRVGWMSWNRATVSFIPCYMNPSADSRRPYLLDVSHVTVRKSNQIGQRKSGNSNSGSVTEPVTTNVFEAL